MLLESRRLKYFPDIDPSGSSHVFFTNDEVDLFNNQKLNSNSNDLVHIRAEGAYPKGYNLVMTKHKTIEDTPFLMDLFLKKGSRVILKLNVNTSDSLVNGTMGTILDFVYEGSKVKAIIIEFTSFSQRKKFCTYYGFPW